jgi:hypothetical protein
MFRFFLSHPQGDQIYGNIHVHIYIVRDCLTLKMKSICLVETSATTDKSIQCNSPGDLNLKQYRCENLKSRMHSYSFPLSASSSSLSPISHLSLCFCVVFHLFHIALFFTRTVHLPVSISRGLFLYKNSFRPILYLHLAMESRNLTLTLAIKKIGLLLLNELINKSALGRSYWTRPSESGPGMEVPVPGNVSICHKQHRGALQYCLTTGRNGNRAHRHICHYKMHRDRSNCERIHNKEKFCTVLTEKC